MCTRQYQDYFFKSAALNIRFHLFADSNRIIIYSNCFRHVRYPEKFGHLMHRICILIYRIKKYINIINNNLLSNSFVFLYWKIIISWCTIYEGTWSLCSVWYFARLWFFTLNFVHCCLNGTSFLWRLDNCCILVTMKCWTNWGLLRWNYFFLVWKTSICLNQPVSRLTILWTNIS